MTRPLNLASGKAILDVLPDPVFVCDSDGTIDFVNRAAIHLFGEPAEGFIGRRFEEFVPERIRSITTRPFHEWLIERHESALPFRAPVRRSDGIEIDQRFDLALTDPADGAGALIIMLRHPGAEEDLDTTDEPPTPLAEQIYEAVFESVPVGVLHFDARGRITALNDMLAAQMGSDRETLTGLDMLTLPDERVCAAVQAALDGREGYFDGEYTSATGGRTRLLVATFSPLMREGQAEGGVGVVDDVTERRAIEARLAQGDRMASLGRLAAGVAHEINNPLAYVRTSLDIMDRALAGLEASAGTLARANEALLKAYDGVERVRVIAGDLKTFSRGDEGSWLPVDLRVVVDTAVNLAWNEIRHRAELVRELRAVPTVMGSETRFVQVLVNLLVNAAHAIDERGGGSGEQITVRLGEMNPDRVFIEVRDTGIGIPADRVSRIFEPFWSSKPKSQGTGLGLSICHGIVSAAGGEIRVTRSTPQVGTTFRIELPAIRGLGNTKHIGTAGPLPSSVARRGRLLVIDDELRLARTLELALEDHIDIEVIESGQGAIELLTVRSNFDMVLCDLMMPEVSGMDVYTHVAANDPKLAERFVFMTGGAFTDRARDFLKEQKRPRLEKPFALEDVERLLAERLRDD